MNATFCLSERGLKPGDYILDFALTADRQSTRENAAKTPQPEKCSPEFGLPCLRLCG